MFTGWLSRGTLGLAAALMAPAALACENPDNITYTLRRVPPASASPDQFVLEVDVASRKDVEEAPIEVKLSDGDALNFPSFFAVFDVKQVLSGDFAAKQVRIPNMLSTCSAFSYGSDASYFVGRWVEGPDGNQELRVVSMTRGELREQNQVDQKVAH